MTTSPKRTIPSEDPANEELQLHKKPRLMSTSAENNQPSNGTASTAPDSQINHSAAIAYWSSTEPTVNGVLGGYPQVSRVDLQGSNNFLAKLRRGGGDSQGSLPVPPQKLRRAVDCGAGIGRITTGLLVKVAEKVDIVEPVVQFTDVVKGQEGVGEVYNVGLEDWRPRKEDGTEYDLIWNQWCVGQLTDAQLVAYLKRLPGVLNAGGWIVVKENLSTSGEDVFDETDSSVTRTDAKFRALFEEADLKLVKTEVQKGMPADLYPVQSYALQPK